MAQSQVFELHGGDRSPNDPVILLVTRQTVEAS